MLKKRIRKLIKSAIAETGWQIRISRADAVVDLVTHTRKLFNDYQIDTVLDVGANIGQYALWLRQVVGFQGTILSFEPVEPVHTTLKERASRDKNWHTFQVALGAGAATRKINVGSKTVFSSFLSPSRRETSIYADENSTASVEVVKIESLDQLWPRLKEKYGMVTPFLKLDTQGFDLEVLKGADTVAAHIPGLQTEMSFLALYDEMPDFAKVWSVLKERGFDLCGLYPVFHDHQGRIGEADGIFLNRFFVSPRKQL